MIGGEAAGEIEKVNDQMRDGSGLRKSKKKGRGRQKGCLYRVVGLLGTNVSHIFTGAYLHQYKCVTFVPGTNVGIFVPG
jgi:hypothetical protein